MRDPAFSSFNTIPACDTQTDRRTHDDDYYPRIACTARVKVFVLSHPLGDLGVMYTVHLWLAGKRVVDFLLAIIKCFSLALKAAQLLSKICRNQRYPTGVGHFERKF